MDIKKKIKTDDSDIVKLDNARSNSMFDKTFHPKLAIKTGFENTGYWCSKKLNDNSDLRFM